MAQREALLADSTTSSAWPPTPRAALSEVEGRVSRTRDLAAEGSTRGVPDLAHRARPGLHRADRSHHALAAQADPPADRPHGPPKVSLGGRARELAQCLHLATTARLGGARRGFDRRGAEARPLSELAAGRARLAGEASAGRLRHTC